MRIEAFKRAFERFCNGTSFHGFQQLYQAKTIFWKSFWVVICACAISITSVQVCKTVMMYINQPTNTLILVSEEQEIMYPPLRLCYWQWLYWVDFNKVDQLKVDREALLFSFNFYTRIFTTVPHDMEEAKNKLSHFLNVTNFKSVFEFHQSIARPVPIISDDNFASYFDTTEVTYRNPGFLFCYTVSSERMFDYLNYGRKSGDDPNDKKIVHFSTINENYEYNNNNMSQFVTFREYNRYMLRWIRHKTMYDIKEDNVKNNFTHFAPPVLLFPNAFDGRNDVPVTSETDEYSITLKATASKWQNSKAASLCSVGLKSIGDNESCQFSCEAKVYKPNCSCVRFHYAVFMKKDDPKTVCRDEFIIMSDGGREYPANSTTVGDTVTTQTCYTDQKITDAFANCMNDCPKPCEIWSYKINVLTTVLPSYLRQVGVKRSTNISLEYPSKNDIFVSVEVDSLSLETFISNVGGLLGIWTGCSVLSFIQLAYLCCWADESHTCKRCVAFFTCGKHKIRPKKSVMISVHSTYHHGNPAQLVETVNNSFPVVDPSNRET